MFMIKTFKPRVGIKVAWRRKDVEPANFLVLTPYNIYFIYVLIYICSYVLIYVLVLCSSIYKDKAMGVKLGR